MADPVVHITNGVPDSGTGNITTLGAVVAKQPALGTAGTASADVISVQGIASMTALKVDGSAVTQPVSGTVTANAGTNLNTSALALDATVGTTNTEIGGLTETAPATDTASSGLNGRLQRVAQRLSSLIALLPTALGTGGGIKVDGSGTALPVSGTVTANAGTNLNTSALALETGGNLATIAGAVSSAKVATKAAAADFADGSIATLGLKADAKSTATDTTPITAMSVWKQISATLQTLAGASGTAGTPSATVNSVQGIVGMTPVSNRERYISAAVSTLTRPANVTAYSANDSISDNATAGSVTALSATVSDTNDDPISLTELLVHSTDTGIAAKNIRAWFYNSDPTANSGVVGGDNAAFSNKKAGFIGTMSGMFRTFSDGSVARLVPDEGGSIVTVPTSGAKTIFVQYQTLDAFTPSANSTTLIGTLKGVQGRAA